MKTKKNETRQPRSRPYPVIIEQRGKHYHSRYLVNNEQDRLQVGLEIVQGWKDSGYLYKDTSIPKTFELFVKKETNGMTVSAIEKMTKGSTSKIKVQFGSYNSVYTPQEQLDELKRRYQEGVDYNQSISLALDSLKTKDGTKAWQAIGHLNEGEYMGVKTHTFDNINYP